MHKVQGKSAAPARVTVVESAGTKLMIRCYTCSATSTGISFCLHAPLLGLRTPAATGIDNLEFSTAYSDENTEHWFCTPMLLSDQRFTAAWKARGLGGATDAVTR